MIKSVLKYGKLLCLALLAFINAIELIAVDEQTAADQQITRACTNPINTNASNCNTSNCAACVQPPCACPAQNVCPCPQPFPCPNPCPPCNNKCYVAGRFTVAPTDPYDLYSPTGGDVISQIGCNFTIQRLATTAGVGCSYAVNVNVPFCRRLTAFAFGSANTTDSSITPSTPITVAQSSDRSFIIEIPDDVCTLGATVTFIAVPTT